MLILKLKAFFKEEEKSNLQKVFPLFVNISLSFQKLLS